ncbi:MAG: type I 3-dehydroquinate dehydratase [Rubrivivax sp.]|nr:type I 3-dehydroquinate dehydratase [Rubrivivax sp.]
MVQPRRIELHGQPIGTGAFPSIIVPLVGRTVAEVRAELAAIVPKQPDLLEWRIDGFEGIADTALMVDMAREIKRAARHLPLLLTRRHTREGGQAIALAEPDVVALYARLCEAGCVDFIDYELSNAREQLAHLRAVSARCGVGMILSYHNFQSTPDFDTLLGTFAEAERLGADIAKVAVMPEAPQDVLTLLGATCKASQTLGIPLIGISMGGLGAVSRIMGWQFGSAATFAVGKSGSAPGQLAVEDLRAVLATVRQAAR